MTTAETISLSRRRIHEYVHGLDDADLLELAVQVNVWRTLLEGHGYCAARALLVIALSAVGDAFNERQQRGVWGKVWLTVWHRVSLQGDPPPDVVRANVAEWAAGVAMQRAA